MTSNKLRLKSGLLALLVAGGMTLVHTPKVCAEDLKPKYTEGTFIDNPNEVDEHEESQYKYYVVKEGDNLSRISEKICRHEGHEITTKYWPALAFLNGYPKISNPGDLIMYLEDMDDMDALLQSLKETKWTARYIQANDVYAQDKTSGGYTIKELLIEIYGKKAAEDPAFFKKFMKAQNLYGKYTLDSVVTGTNMLAELTLWIPTFEQLDYQLPKAPKGK